MENLISMTDYVLEKYTLFINGKITSEQFRDNVWNYAKFLSMPLELKMFVACDSENNALEEPEKYMEINTIGSINSYATAKECEDSANYHQALSEVLFEGFKICNRLESVKCVVNRDLHISYENYKTIEDLVNYNLKLTPNAKLKYKF